MSFKSSLAATCKVTENEQSNFAVGADQEQWREGP